MNTCYFERFLCLQKQKQLYSFTDIMFIHFKAIFVIFHVEYVSLLAISGEIKVFDYINDLICIKVSQFNKLSVLS